jgi:hypothetical protein
VPTAAVGRNVAVGDASWSSVEVVIVTPWLRTVMRRGGALLDTTTIVFHPISCPAVSVNTTISITSVSTLSQPDAFQLTVAIAFSFLANSSFFSLLFFFKLWPRC